MRPRILFVATRESTYPRVEIIEQQLQKFFELDIIHSRQRNYALRIFRVLVSLLLVCRRPYAAVFAGFMAQPLFPILRIFWRGPIISDAYFSIFDTLVYDRKIYSKHSWVGRLTKWLDRYMIEHSALTFMDTDTHGAYVRKLIKPSRGTIKRLWISGQDRVFTPCVKGQYRTGEIFEVLFFGGFIPLQGVDIIVRAAKFLEREPIRFELAGKGQTFSAACTLSRTLALHNVHFTGWKSPREIRTLGEKAHLILGIFGTTEKANNVIPNKVFEALAMGKPLITGRSEAVRELLNDGVDVFLVERGNAEALAHKIRWVRDHYEEACRIGKNGFTTFMRKACPDQVGLILNSELSALLKEKVVI